MSATHSPINLVTHFLISCIFASGGEERVGEDSTESEGLTRSSESVDDRVGGQELVLTKAGEEERVGAGKGQEVGGQALVQAREEDRTRGQELVQDLVQELVPARAGDEDRLGAGAAGGEGQVAGGQAEVCEQVAEQVFEQPGEQASEQVCGQGEEDFCERGRSGSREGVRSARIGSECKAQVISSLLCYMFYFNYF